MGAADGGPRPVCPGDGASTGALGASQRAQRALALLSAPRAPEDDGDAGDDLGAGAVAAPRRALGARPWTAGAQARPAGEGRPQAAPQGRRSLSEMQARALQERARRAVASAHEALPAAVPAGAKVAEGAPAAPDLAATGAGGSSGGAIAAAAATAGPALPILAVLAAVVLLVGAVGAVLGGGTSTASTGTLQGNEAYVASYLMGHEHMDALHAAAILGNIAAESGCDPDCCENGDQSARAVTTYLGYGICQWTTLSEKQGLAALAQQMGKEWSSIEVQAAYLCRQVEAWDYSDSYVITSSASTDPVAGTRVSGSRAGFDAATTVEDAVAQACYGWMNFAPGIPRMAVRVQEAKRVLQALSTGTGGSSGGNQAVLAAAMTQVGTPYVWGGTTPYVGLDCSGFTQWCYAQAGIPIPRTAAEQMASGRQIPISEARPGDILACPTHVGIFLGENTFIHSPSPGGFVTVAHNPEALFTTAVRY